MQVEMWTYREADRDRGPRPDGLQVEATDGEVGKVDEAAYELGSSWLVVDTGPWIFGKKVLLPAGTVSRSTPRTARSTWTAPATRSRARPSTTRRVTRTRSTGWRWPTTTRASTRPTGSVRAVSDGARSRGRTAIRGAARSGSAGTARSARRERPARPRPSDGRRPAGCAAAARGQGRGDLAEGERSGRAGPPPARAPSRTRPRRPGSRCGPSTDRRACPPSTRGRRRSCGASMATTAGEVSVSKRTPITLSYSNAFGAVSERRAEAGARLQDQGARVRRRRCRTRQAPGTTTRGCSPGRSMSSSDCWARRCSPPKSGQHQSLGSTRETCGTGVVRSPGGSPRATATPLSRRRPIRSLWDELFPLPAWRTLPCERAASVLTAGLFGK